MANYLNNLVNSSWSIWADLFEGVPYGETYVPVVVLFMLFGLSLKFVAHGRG